MGDPNMLLRTPRRIRTAAVLASLVFAAVMYPIFVNTHGEARALAMLPLFPVGLLIGRWARMRAKCLVRS